jgi:hypothetical protein
VAFDALVIVQAAADVAAVAVGEGLGVTVAVAVGAFAVAPPQAASARPIRAAADPKRARRRALIRWSSRSSEPTLGPESE